MCYKSKEQGIVLCIALFFVPFEEVSINWSVICLVLLFIPLEVYLALFAYESICSLALFFIPLEVCLAVFAYESNCSPALFFVPLEVCLVLFVQCTELSHFLLCPSWGILGHVPTTNSTTATIMALDHISVVLYVANSVFLGELPSHISTNLVILMSKIVLYLGTCIFQNYSLQATTPQSSPYLDPTAFGSSFLLPLPPPLCCILHYT